MGCLVRIVLSRQPDASYQVKLVDIRKAGQPRSVLTEEIEGRLTSTADVKAQYCEWQQSYRRLSPYSRGLTSVTSVKHKTSTNYLRECRQASEQLAGSMNQLLNDRGLIKIQRSLSRHLAQSDEIRLKVETDDEELCQLPFSVWNLLEDYPKAEIFLSASNYRGTEQPLTIKPRNRVRILAVCGDATGIDYQRDRESIKKLDSVGAKPIFLQEPSADDVRNRLWEKGWDILFFAGHSDSDEELQESRIYLNDKHEYLTLDDLENTLKKSVEQGLKLAIFNSCNGLGIARHLVAKLNIPVAIAMREPVPNRVAQEFLDYFLVEYAYNHQSLGVAVRRARQRIDDKWKKQFPGVDWLPVICQNPTQRPPAWNELYRRISLKEVAIANLTLTLIVLSIRVLGILQPLELFALDRLMLLRPAEQPDDKLLIVGITEGDIAELNEFPISDKTVVKLLKTLEQHQPRAIGLDIIRDVKVGEGRAELLQFLQDSERVISVCSQTIESPTESPTESPNAENQLSGSLPPPGVPDERLGFIDVPFDRDRVIRRQFLALDPDESCSAEHSFNFQIVQHYLKAEGIEPELTPDGNLKFGNTIFTRFGALTGGYQNEETGGYQILFNYRARKQAEQIAQQVTLTAVINNQVNPDLIKDRAILIGYTAESAKDSDFTPYTAVPPYRKTPGVIIQAHMVSQMLSAVLEQRPLLWAWPWWVDGLWIGFWSGTVGLLWWKLHKPLPLGIALGLGLVSLPTICFMALWLDGCWLPLVPSLFVVLGTGGSLALYISFPWQRT